MSYDLRPANIAAADIHGTHDCIVIACSKSKLGLMVLGARQHRDNLLVVLGGLIAVSASRKFKTFRPNASTKHRP